MKRTFLTALFLAVVAFSATVASATTIIAPAPETEALCGDFTVRVDGENAPVYSCRVSAIPFNRVWPGYQRSLDQTELAGFAIWETDGPVEVVVETTRTIESPESVTLRPKSLGLEPKIDAANGRITFKMEKPSPVVVEIGDFHNALHLLPTPIFERPKDLNAPNLRYFGPGVSEPGVVDLKSGDKVFLDAGAVVYGGFRGRDVENVEIAGPGILDASKLDRSVGNGLFSFSGSKNVEINGILQRDSNVWSTTLSRCDDVTIRNTRLVGMWRYNADGIDVCNSERVLVENCFVRSFDDGLVVKGVGGPKQQKSVRDVTFRNCVVWCDWGRVAEIGAETCAPEIANVRFDGIDAIRSTHITLDIQHGDRAKISGIVFNDIRVEIDDSVPTPVYQNSDEQQYDPGAGYVPTLMTLVIARTGYSQDETNGTISDVVFKDVRVWSKRRPASVFVGRDAERGVDGVVVENLRFNDGAPAKSAEEANLQIGANVRNVEFRE